jgi:tetratricopeptide (TPR) repeat protein
VNNILEKQIDELNSEISRSLGISEEKLEEGRRSIVDVTTSSMEAYRYFQRGRDSFERLYNDDARRYLEKAVELDPDFAVAHLYLARVYDRLRDLDRRNESFEKAKTLADRATKKEHLYIEAAYARTVEQDQDKRYQLLRQIAREYPREKRVHHRLASYYRGKRQFYQAVEEYKKVLELDPNYGWALNELAYMYTDIEEFEQAAEYFQKYASISPGDANPIDSMGELCFRMGKLDEAIEKYKEALQVKPDFYYAYWEIAYIYALKENYSETLSWIDKYIDHAPSLGTRAEGCRWKSFYLCWQGNWKMALEISEELTGVARERESEFWVTEAERIRGWIYYDKGEYQRSRGCFQRCVKAIQSNPKEYIPPTSSYSPDAKEQLAALEASYSFVLGLLDLNEKDIAAARSRLAEMQSLLPYYSALLHAEILLTERSAEKAITVCEKAPQLQIPYMSDMGGMFSYNLPFMKDVLARAYLQKKNPDRAILEYERLTSFRPEGRDRRLIHPMCHYQLGKLFLEEGRSRAAAEQYKRALEIWKDAQVAELEDARKRLQVLRSED